MGTVLYLLLLLLLIVWIRTEVLRGRSWPLWFYLIGGPILCAALFYYVEFGWAKPSGILASLGILSFGFFTFIILIVALIVVRLRKSRRARLQAVAEA